MELLNKEEVRVLGCLIEKAATTPDYYPLTLNALTHACNQKSNRDPVVDYSEATVETALEGLHRKKLCIRVHQSGSRTIKYAHDFDQVTGLEPEAVAMLAEMMLRGAQTVGELRGRASRMHTIADLKQAEDILFRLAAGASPLVVKLPREAGRRENRYTHCFCGQEDEGSQEESTLQDGPPAEVAEPAGTTGEDLRCEVQALRRELTTLRQEFEAFKEQF